MIKNIADYPVSLMILIAATVVDFIIVSVFMRDNRSKKDKK